VRKCDRDRTTRAKSDFYGKNNFIIVVDVVDVVVVVVVVVVGLDVQLLTGDRLLSIKCYGTLTTVKQHSFLNTSLYDSPLHITQNCQFKINAYI